MSLFHKPTPMTVNDAKPTQIRYICNNCFKYKDQPTRLRLTAPLWPVCEGCGNKRDARATETTDE